MAVKHGKLLVHSAPFQTNGIWVPCIVAVKNDKTLFIISESKEQNTRVCKTYTLATDWFVIAPRINSSTHKTPELPENKTTCELFALAQPPDITIWCLANSKLERDQWVKAILPLVTLSVRTTNTSLPPPYTEYDNWPHKSNFCFPTVISQPKSEVAPLSLRSSRSKTYEVQKKESAKPDPDPQTTEANVTRGSVVPPNNRAPADSIRNMAEEEAFGWVFDSLVGFLKGPVWEAAVLTFIEKKSVVFDPVEGNDVEYKKLHEEYKDLVDTMLSSHMEDLGISPEQFDQACGETEKNIHSQFRKSLFEQLYAADDYEIFKRMMTQKNLELQLQALDLLAHQYGLLPEAFLPAPDHEPSPQEKAVMETVLKRYVEENPENSNTEEQSEQKEVIQATKARLEVERRREKNLMEQAIETSLHDSPKSEREEKPLEITKMTEVSPEEARRRQEYLMQQRDKLLALKKQERQKLLQRFEEAEAPAGAGGRPRSARAAAQRAVQEEKPEHGLDPKVLAFRKSLAARLKAEVVDKK